MKVCMNTELCMNTLSLKGSSSQTASSQNIPWVSNICKFWELWCFHVCSSFLNSAFPHSTVGSFFLSVLLLLEILSCCSCSLLHIAVSSASSALQLMESSVHIYIYSLCTRNGTLWQFVSLVTLVSSLLHATITAQFSSASEMRTFNHTVNRCNNLHIYHFYFFFS